MGKRFTRRNPALFSDWVRGFLLFFSKLAGLAPIFAAAAATAPTATAVSAFEPRERRPPRRKKWSQNP